jgi:hypothetical protein
LSHTSSFFCLILEISLLAQASLDHSRLSYFTLPTMIGMTGAHHHTQLLSENMGSSKLFFLDWPGTAILLVSAYQVTRSTCISHLCLWTILLLGWDADTAWKLMTTQI